MIDTAWDERTEGRNYTDENGVPAHLLLDTDVPTGELDISESPHTREMTFVWEISTIFIILLFLFMPQTSTVWEDTERLENSMYRTLGCVGSCGHRRREFTRPRATLQKGPFLTVRFA